MTIEIHGFWATSCNNTIEEIWSKILERTAQEKWSEHIVTFVHAETSGKNGKISPFIRIYSDNKQDFQTGIQLLKEIRLPGAGVQTFVECILLEQRVKL
jgi:hypothetical protein